VARVTSDNRQRQRETSPAVRRTAATPTGPTPVIPGLRARAVASTAGYVPSAEEANDSVFEVPQRTATSSGSKKRKRSKEAVKSKRNPASGMKSGGKKKQNEKQDKNDNGEKEKQKKHKKKNSKSKKKKACSSSDSESSVDSSCSSSSSSSSDSEESDSSSKESGSESSEGPSKKGKKKKKTDKLDWELLDDLWPIEDRPRKLQSRKNCGKISMNKMMRMKASFEREQEKRGLGVAVYSRDRKPKSRSFKAKKDDGARKLHKARFQCLPRTEPDQYWGQVPVKWQQIYRHLPLKHLGVDGVPEATIVKIHNRTVPIDMELIIKDIKEVRQVQLAVLYYVAILRNVHPYDYGGLVIQNVLTGK
jgi:hypothetical protein